MNLKSIVSSILLLLSGITLCKAVDSSNLFPVIESWSLSEKKVYNASNLYNPIDGAADMFLSYNFEEMQAVDYTCDSDYISVEVYRHKTPIDAFGAYSQERPDRNIYFEIGVQGYKEGDYINFLAGRYYIKIRTWRANEKSLKAMHEIARKQAEALNGNTKFPGIFSIFPEKGRIPFSEKYFNENVLGFKFLHSSFEVSYSLDNRSFTLFLLKSQNESEVKNMLEEYFKYLKLTVDDMSDKLYTIDDMYNGKMFILKSGNYLICARGEIAEENIKDVLNEIKGKIRSDLF
ncbi:MAG TPA: DUF6599 family protein [Bacteroidales bacterium]